MSNWGHSLMSFWCAPNVKALPRVKDSIEDKCEKVSSLVLVIAKFAIDFEMLKCQRQSSLSSFRQESNKFT